jgi:hypothetical protein
MARHEREGGAGVKPLGGETGPLHPVLDRPRELGARGFDGGAVALGDDVRSAAHVDELRGPVAGHGSAGGEPVAHLPPADHHDPGHRERREHRRGRAGAPAQAAAAEQEPEGDGHDEKQADGARQRRHGQERPHPQGKRRARPSTGEEAQSGGHAGEEQSRERRLREEEARRRHRRDVEGQQEAGDPGRALAPEPVGQPGGQGHGEGAEGDSGPDNHPRLLSSHGVHERDQQGEGGCAACLRGALGPGREARVVQERASQRLVFVGIRGHVAARIHGRGGHEHPRAQAQGQGGCPHHRPPPGRRGHQA